MILCFVFGLVLFGRTLLASQEEPVCTSRFDYDHKMLQKMVMLEIEQRNTKIALEEIKTALSKQAGKKPAYISLIISLLFLIIISRLDIPVIFFYF
jgi:hypothetical protein